VRQQVEMTDVAEPGFEDYYYDKQCKIYGKMSED
jgi:hypothetical protein